MSKIDVSEIMFKIIFKCINPSLKNIDIVTEYF